MEDTSLKSLDLRKISKNGLSEYKRDKIKHIMKEEGLLVKFKDKGKKIYIHGAEWDTKEYLSLAKRYKKNVEKINRYKERYYVNSGYDYPPLHELSTKVSNAKSGIKGLSTLVKSQKTILKRKLVEGEDGKFMLNSIERAAVDKYDLRKMKMESYNNPKEMMTMILNQQGLFHITKSGKTIQKNMQYFMDENGNYRNKSRELEYLSIFSDYIQERYEDYEEEFIGWAYDNLGGNAELDILGKEYNREERIKNRNEGRKEYYSLSRKEQQDLYREFVRSKLDDIKETKLSGGAYENIVEPTDKEFRIISRNVSERWKK